MVSRVLEFGALLASLLVLPLGAHLIMRRLVLPRIAYRLLAEIGFCGWLALLGSYRTAYFQGGGTIEVFREWWIIMSPFLLPLEAGYLGWLGLGSSSRWLLLELILAAGFLPIVAAVILHLLRY